MTQPFADLSPRDWRRRGAYYAHRGHEVFRHIEGHGPALVCLHGFPTASWDWHRIWEPLTARFRVLAPDLIGYGFSAKPIDYEYSTFDQADLIEALVDSLGIRQAHVLAHDYGDTVVQELLARRLQHPGRGFEIQSVCLLNGGIFVEAIRLRPIQRLLLTPLGPLISALYGQRSFDRNFRPLFGPDTQPTRQQLDAFWELITYNQGSRVLHLLIRYLRERARYRERWVRALVDAPVPVRFIVGSEDLVSGQLMADRYRELVPDPDVVMVHGIGHYPQLEAPAAVLREFFAFQAAYR